MMQETEIIELKEIISREKLIVREMVKLSVEISNAYDLDRKKLISTHLNSLKKSLRQANDKIPLVLGKINVNKSLPVEKAVVNISMNTGIKPIEIKPPKKPSLEETEMLELERETIKRLKRKEKKIVQKKLKKPSLYVKTASRLFSKMSSSLEKEKMFRPLKRDLVKASLKFLPSSYISVILFTTLLSFFVGIFLFVFFLFFNISAKFPFILAVGETFGLRLLKTFWIVLAVPIGTSLFMYFYPSMEKRVSESKIDQEIPFATIHMSAISGSMVEPSKIFEIIIKTKEYPALEKEFVKLINEINIYGYDLVSALRSSAFNSPSKKLAELLNGLATTINSGGDLPIFFDKRAQSLLFEYRLEREKYTRTAETFMDIYISVVIAAPMILMLLLMMMKVSGLGVSISTAMITFLIVLGVGMINIIFLVFLHLKQPVS